MTPLHIRFFLAALTLASAGLPPAFAQTTERVSVNSAGAQANGYSIGGISLSATGRFVAFASDATNLVSGGTNGLRHVYVHDRLTGATTLVSVDSAGAQGIGISQAPSLSADGRWVVFRSSADNLVPADTNGVDDIFLHDRLTGQTSRVSLTSAGGESNGQSLDPVICASGRSVAFTSWASNLVPGDTNNFGDVFVRDLQLGQTLRVSVEGTGLQGNRESAYPSLSATGRQVAFVSWASNLVAGDTNGFGDTFVHDVQSGSTIRVSVDSAGGQGNVGGLNPSISADGLSIAFQSDSWNLTAGDTNGQRDAFVRDLNTGQTIRVSVDSNGFQANGESAYPPAISADGRYVSFSSTASNLIAGDVNGVQDVFVHDRLTGQTSCISLGATGGASNGFSEGQPSPPMSGDGRFVAFLSDANNLVPGDTNAARDVFIRDRLSVHIAKTGACPGAITLTVDHATANGAVAILHGPAGTFVKPTPPCQGITLGVSPPTLGTVVSANGSGTAILNFNAPPGACGLSVQAVDVTTCVATNVIVL